MSTGGMGSKGTTASTYKIRIPITILPGVAPPIIWPWLCRVQRAVCKKKLRKWKYRGNELYDGSSTFIETHNNFRYDLDVHHFRWKLDKFAVVVFYWRFDCVEIESTEMRCHNQKHSSGIQNCTHKSISKMSMIINATISFKINRIITSMTSAKNRLYSGAKTYSNPPFWLMTGTKFLRKIANQLMLKTHQRVYFEKTYIWPSKLFTNRRRKSKRTNDWQISIRSATHTHFLHSAVDCWWIDFGDCFGSYNSSTNGW